MSSDNNGSLPEHPVERVALLEALRPQLHALAKKKLSPALQRKVAVSDLVQETIIAGHEDMASFNGKSLAELRAWVQQILVNRAAYYGRKFHKQQKQNIAREVTLDNVQPSDKAAGRPSQELHKQETEALLQKAFDSLSEKSKRIIHLRRVDKKKVEEIAVELQTSEDNVRQLFKRAMERWYSKYKALVKGRSTTA